MHIIVAAVASFEGHSWMMSWLSKRRGVSLSSRVACQSCLCCTGDSAEFS